MKQWRSIKTRRSPFRVIPNFIISILFVFVIVTSFAQTASFVHFGVEKGIAQSQVQTIDQDKDGNLWIGTMAGLTRYDGYSFDQFTRRDSLEEEWVTASYINDSGDIWLGHWAGGISYYYSSTKTFTNFSFEANSRYNSITGIIEDQFGNAWISTAGAGAFFYDKKTSEITSFALQADVLSSSIASLMMDAKGRLWFATDEGIVIYDLNLGEGNPSAFSMLTTKDGLPSNKINCLTLLENKDVAVGTEEGVVIINNSANKISEEGFIRLSTDNVLPSNRITSLMEDSQGYLWIGTSNAGVCRYDQQGGSATSYSVRNGLNYNTVNVVFEDREKNIWIGTDLGLNLFRGETFLLFDKRDSLVNNIIWSVLEDSKRNLWLGTNGGVSKLEFVDSPKAKAGRFEVTTTNFTRKDGLKDDLINCVFEDSEGSIWVGTASGGAAKYDSDQNKFVTIDSVGGPTGMVYAINEDTKGNIWFGTREGATRLDKRSGKLIEYTVNNGLGGSNIFRIFRDSKSQLWFAPLGGALTVFDGARFRPFTKKEGVPEQLILAITEDEQGNIWLGTYGGGLFKFDGSSFKNYSTREGLSSNSPYSIVTDNKNRLWIGTNIGVDCYDQSTNTFTHYSSYDGFQGVEVNAGATCRDSRGNIWFGTIMGAVRYNPNEQIVNTVAPITTLAKPKVYQKEYPFPQHGAYPSDQNHLTFSFTGVSLSNPDKILYRYMLEGFDKDWSDPTHNREATYANLPHGKYVFKVLAGNGDSVWTDEPIDLAFSVQPPFWRTWWFYLLVFGLVIMGALIVDRFRTSNLMDAKELLEKKIDQRTNELTKKNQELAYKNRSINESITYAQQIQRAILPAPESIRDRFKDSFVLHKPKESVSGDFYWVEEVGQTLLLSVVDCAGHGVPGAFMSLMGYASLNRTVSEFGLVDPGEILQKLNDILHADMSSNEGNITSGIDLAVCALDSKGKKLRYAGANSSLYIVRPIGAGETSITLIDKNDGGDDLADLNYKLVEYKADKRSVGSGKSSKPFTCHDIDLKDGDTVFLFTDGFADQFGGDQGKKFQYNRLKQLLLFNHDKNMEELGKVLDQTFEEWRGDMEQTDDICVIGFRV